MTHEAARSLFRTTASRVSFGALVFFGIFAVLFVFVDVSTTLRHLASYAETAALLAWAGILLRDNRGNLGGSKNPDDYV